MKIITDTKSISLVQKACLSAKEDILKEYKQIGDKVYHKVGFFSKAKTYFRIPPSLRFFHKGQWFAKDSELKRMKELYKTYHNIYWVIEEIKCLSCKQNHIVTLSEYESETYIYMAEYLGIEINSYSKNVDINNEIQMANINKIINC